MKIIALEFSSDRRSVAVLDEATGRTGGAMEEGGRAAHTTTLVEAALREAGLARTEIECLAVGLGPGSYAGIRAAIALAQGWQLAREVRLLGLGSVEGLAALAQAEGLQGHAHIVIDAQRNEFYHAAYDLAANQRREVTPLHLASFAEIAALAQSGTLLLGPEVDRWFPGARVLFPEAGTLVTLARHRADFLPGEQLEPIYLRETSFVKAPPPRRIE